MKNPDNNLLHALSAPVATATRGWGGALAFAGFTIVALATAALTQEPKEFTVEASAPAVSSVTSLPLLGGVYDPLDRYQSLVVSARLDVARCRAMAATPSASASADLMGCVSVASDNIQVALAQARQASLSKTLDQAVAEFAIQALRDLRGLAEGQAVESGAPKASADARLRLKDLGTFVLLEACSLRKDCLFERQAPVRAMERAGLI